MQEKPDGTNAVSDAQKKTVFSDNRARLISLNESLQIWNTIRHKELKGKQATHTWQSMEDDRVRPTHAEADGQTVPIEEPFKVGKYMLMYPGDSSLLLERSSGRSKNPPTLVVWNVKGTLQVIVFRLFAYIGVTAYLRTKG